jgi:hypothetical protein
MHLSDQLEVTWRTSHGPLIVCRRGDGLALPPASPSSLSSSDHLHTSTSQGGYHVPFLSHHGWEVDRAARNVITERGYAEFFVHRTGHSIGEEVHGNGTNIDDLETHDDREIIPFTGFSIEPGIYLPEFGVRSEVNVYVEKGSARVTGRIQDRVVRIGG